MNKPWYDSQILDHDSYRERVEGALKWILLPRLKEYLKKPSLDGSPERQRMRAEMGEIIAKIDELERESELDNN